MAACSYHSGGGNSGKLFTSFVPENDLVLRIQNKGRSRRVIDEVFSEFFLFQQGFFYLFHFCQLAPDEVMQQECVKRNEESSLSDGKGREKRLGHQPYQKQIGDNN